MLAWLESVAGPDYAMAVVWTVAALVLLVVVLVIVKLIRGMTFGTFVAGGRNRKTRLAVMDATAVDSHRRLVLVRRDDVEHLILIGGPTDVVVERDIRLGQPRRPALTGEGTHEVAPPPRPRPPEPAPQRAPPQQQPARAERPLQPPPQTPRPVERSQPPVPQAVARPQPQVPPPAPIRPAPPRLPSSAPPQQMAANGIAAARQPAPQLARTVSLDEDLLRELEVTLDAVPTSTKKAVNPPELSLDDEMTKLLGELASHKRS